MRLSGFIVMLVGLALSWVSLGFLKWIDIAVNKKPFIRWQDLKLVLDGADEVASGFSIGFVAPGLLIVVGALSVLAPALFAYGRTLRIVLASLYLLLTLVVCVTGVIVMSDSESIPEGERGIVVLAIVLYGLILAIPAVLLFLDKAWGLGYFVAVIAAGSAVALGFSLYDLFADAAQPPQIGAYAAVVGLLIIAVAGYLAAEGGRRHRRALAEPGAGSLTVAADSNGSQA